MSAVDETQVKTLRQMIEELGILEREMSLIQRDTYNVLQKFLQLDDIQLSAVFPDWHQEEHRSHLRSLSTSLDEHLSSAAAATNYAQDFKIKKSSSVLLLSSSSSSSSAHHHGVGAESGGVSVSSLPSPLPDDLDELLDEMRICRAKLLKYRERKALSDVDMAKKLSWEARLREAQEKHEEMVKMRYNRSN